MVAFSFKSRFASAVTCGTKRQTIRACRRDGRDPAPGVKLQLYSGMRTQHCRKLGDAVLESRSAISITHDAVTVDGRALNLAERHALAVADGFTDAASFNAFFMTTHGLPFDGYLYRWSNFVAARKGAPAIGRDRL